ALGLHIAFSMAANTTFRGWVGLDADALLATSTAARIATGFGTLAVLASVVGLYYMTRCYRIKARPFWNHWQVGTAFGGSALSLAVGLLAGMLLQPGVGLPTLLGWAVVGTTLLATSLVGRALFYVLVIPTTMPGAFFWKNKAFEEHARDIGLANMPQVGVAPL